MKSSTSLEPVRRRGTRPFRPVFRSATGTLVVVYTKAWKMLMKFNDITEYTEVLANTQVPTYRHQTIDVRQTRMLSSGTAIWGNGISLRGGGQAIPKLSIPLILVNDYIDVLPL